MKTLSLTTLTTFALLLPSGIWAPSAIQAAALDEPASGQIAFDNVADGEPSNGGNSVGHRMDGRRVFEANEGRSRCMIAVRTGVPAVSTSRTASHCILEDGLAHFARCPIIHGNDRLGRKNHETSQDSSGVPCSRRRFMTPEVGIGGTGGHLP